MDNRIILNQTFRSEYFNPGTNKTKRKNESNIDLYIFFQQDVSLDSIFAFHVPFSYIYDYVNSPSYSDEEGFIMDIILHHKVVYTINNPDSTIEELYLSLLEYFCFGPDLIYAIDSYPDGGFGMVVLFDEDYHHPSITSIVEPDTNQGKFYLNNKRK